MERKRRPNVFMHFCLGSHIDYHYFCVKCVQRKLDIAGNYIITKVSSLYHICKKKQVNLSYSACHEKR